MFSLAKLSYMACSEKEKWFYDHDLETLEIDVQPCCVDLLEHIKNGTDHFNNGVDVFCGGEMYAPRQSVVEKAAIHGHLECLELARAQGCPWDQVVCENAAADGNLAVLKYAHENGCPWDEQVCRVAARNGKLKCLEYARENGCPWDENAREEAASNGILSRLECVIHTSMVICGTDERGRPHPRTDTRCSVFCTPTETDVRGTCETAVYDMTDTKGVCGMTY